MPSPDKSIGSRLIEAVDAYARQKCRDGQATAAGAEKRNAVKALLSHVDDLALAVRDWLHFDGDVEPPAHDAPYDEHLAYQKQRVDITERVCEVLDALAGQPANRLPDVVPRVLGQETVITEKYLDGIDVPATGQEPTP